MFAPQNVATVRISSARLNQLIGERRFTPELVAAVSGLTPLEIEAMQRADTSVNASVAERLAVTLNTSVPLLAGISQPAPVDMPLAPPVVNQADVLATQQAAAKAAPPPVPPPPPPPPPPPTAEALQVPWAVAMPERPAGPDTSGLLRGKKLVIPGDLFGFAVRSGLDPAVVLIVDRISNLVYDAHPGLRAATQRQVEALYAASIPLARVVVHLAVAASYDLFPEPDALQAPPD